MTSRRRKRVGARLIPVTAAFVTAIVLAACGSAEKPAAQLGSPQRPLVAQLTPDNEDRSTHGQSEQGKVAGGAKVDISGGVTPCGLVSRSQARAILGAPVVAPLEAPLGPTCIYRTKAGSTFVTISVQSLNLDRVKKQMRRLQPIHISRRPAYCGTYGEPMLYVPLARQRVLTVGGPCPVAKQFAERAVARLGG